jgi:ferredoxin
MSYVISKACTKCGACILECPTGSIVEGRTQFYIDADSCAEHAACVNVCPVKAISKADDFPLLPKKKAGNDEEE